jgi:hypothetical protein
MIHPLRKMRIRLYLYWSALLEMIEDTEIESEMIDEMFNDLIELCEELKGELKGGKNER